LQNDYLENLSFWNKLTKNEQADLTKNSIIKEYTKGSIIHSETNKCLGMIIIIEGIIRTCIISQEGREITLFKLKKNDCCVLSADCAISQITFETLMTAENDCKVIIINSNYFNKLITQNIYARCYTYKLITEKFSSVMWVMQQILFNKFDRRLALFLIDENKKKHTSKIKITQEQIAKELNTAREVVSRMLKRFETDGLIKMQRGIVEIIDLENLKNI
jgi:CRP/FNR family transcriptional regulator